MGTCERARTRLAAHAVGGGSRRQRARLCQHLAACPRCRRELSALERTARLVAALPVEPAPAGTWGAIRAQIAARAGPHGLSRRRRAPLHGLRWRLAVASVILLVIGASLLSLSPRPPVLPPAVPVAQADPDLGASLESHLSTVRFAPLADDAAIGLSLEPVESGS